MFAGEYLCKLDEKGRFLLPTPVREQLEADSSSVVLLRGQEPSLWVYSASEWQQLLARTRAKLDEDQSRLFMHHMVAEASSADIDKTGRILIPGRLRKAIPVDDDQEIVLVGMYTRLELWNPSEWRRYLARFDEQYEQQLGKFLNLL